MNLLTLFNFPEQVTFFRRQFSIYLSAGYDLNIIRFEQAKSRPNNPIYGMECNGSSTMYLLQSYGLIPPNMSRKEFEIAFTPMHGNKPNNIKVNGREYTEVAPIDIFTPVLDDGFRLNGRPTMVSIGLGRVSFTEALLRGANDVGGSPLRDRIPGLISAFKKLAENPIYKPVLNFRKM